MPGNDGHSLSSPCAPLTRTVHAPRPPFVRIRSVRDASDELLGEGRDGGEGGGGVLEPRLEGWAYLRQPPRLRAHVDDARAKGPGGREGVCGDSGGRDRPCRPLPPTASAAALRAPLPRASCGAGRGQVRGRDRADCRRADGVRGRRAEAREERVRHPCGAVEVCRERRACLRGAEEVALVGEAGVVDEDGDARGQGRGEAGDGVGVGDVESAELDGGGGGGGGRGGGGLKCAENVGLGLAPGLLAPRGADDVDARDAGEGEGNLFADAVRGRKRGWWLWCVVVCEGGCGRRADLGRADFTTKRTPGWRQSQPRRPWPRGHGDCKVWREGKGVRPLSPLTRRAIKSLSFLVSRATHVQHAYRLGVSVKLIPTPERAAARAHVRARAVGTRRENRLPTTSHLRALPFVLYRPSRGSFRPEGTSLPHCQLT